MKLFFYNTLTKQKEEFVPIKEGEVRMYNCGPTVYNYAHIGNLRAYVFADILRRTLEFNTYKVTQVINVTDIGHLSSDGDDGDDKMTRALKREGKPMTLEAMREIANFYFEKFKEDLQQLNIETPHHFPFASDHIKEDIELIQKLVDKGATYTTSDGVYFDTQSFPSYGELGGAVSTNDEHSRIGLNAEKKNPRDFALWKFNAELGYDAPWGKGFPGWHIECSAMSEKYLGQPFDIHTGGIDHIPVHHNNEIAQSEKANDKKYVNYWLHNAHLNVGEDKMAKSGENFITLVDFVQKGDVPLVYRYLLLTTHYRSPMNFSWEAVNAAGIARKNIIRALWQMPEDGKVDSNFLNQFTSFINDDLGTPQALALIFEVLKSDITDADKKATILKFDEVLGLRLDEKIEEESIEIPIAVQNLLKEREVAREKKDFARSDMLRTEIANLGYHIDDTPDGVKVSKK